jgi:hypothetical protein
MNEQLPKHEDVCCSPCTTVAQRSYRFSHIRYTSRVRCFRTSELHSSVQLGKPSNVGFAPLAVVALPSISSAWRA